MTHAIAWSDLAIATTEQPQRLMLLRQFQLIADDLGDKPCRGSVGLQLTDAYSIDEYSEMALSRVMEFVKPGAPIVMMPTREDYLMIGSYLVAVVNGFQERLND